MTRPRRRLRVFSSRAHAWLYQRTGGRAGGRIAGQPVLLLTSQGRRSGKQRTTPVQYQRDGDDLVLVAAAGGSPQPPAWWLNLQADQRATIQLGSRLVECRARTATREERDRLWPQLVAGNRLLPRVERKAKRRLPLVVLTLDRDQVEG